MNFPRFQRRGFHGGNEVSSTGFVPTTDPLGSPKPRRKAVVHQNFKLIETSLVFFLANPYLVFFFFFVLNQKKKGTSGVVQRTSSFHIVKINFVGDAGMIRSVEKVNTVKKNDIV